MGVAAIPPTAPVKVWRFWRRWRELVVGAERARGARRRRVARAVEVYILILMLKKVVDMNRVDKVWLEESKLFECVKMSDQTLEEKVSKWKDWIGKAWKSANANADKPSNTKGI